MRPRTLGLCLFLLHGCGTPTEPPTSPLPPAQPVQPHVGDWVDLELTDGSHSSGELVATYDHRLWWDPSEQQTYALFDSSLLAQYPNDRSMRFVSSLDIATVAASPLPANTTAYADRLRHHAIVINASPLWVPALVFTGNGDYHLEENGYGDFAWDLMMTDDNGARFTGVGAANSDFFVWDTEVYLPNAGTVVEVIRDAPDNDPGSYVEGSDNNMVGIQLFGSFYLYILHFRQSTIPLTVTPDAYLPAGTYLGRVGNSGVSLEPHVHMTLLWYDGNADEPRSWSLPAEFANLQLADSAGGPSVGGTYVVPTSGTWINNQAF